MRKPARQTRGRQPPAMRIPKMDPIVKTVGQTAMGVAGIGAITVLSVGAMGMMKK